MGDIDDAKIAGLVHVIVDDPSVRNSLAFLLEANGFVVPCYESVDVFLQAEPPQAGCIILAYEAPDGDGLASLAKIRRERSLLPVVLLAGMIDPYSRAFAREQSVSAIFETPLSESDLMATLGSLSSRGKPTGSG